MRLILAPLLVLVLVVACGAPTDAQNTQPPSSATAGASKSASIQDRPAARVASEAILRSVFSALGTSREDLTLPNLALETRLAIPASWNSTDSMVQTTIQIMDNALDVVAALSKGPDDLDLFIQVSGKYAADNSDVRALEIKNEISFNQLVSSERAAQAIRAEQAIRSKIGPKIDATHAKLSAGIRDRLTSHPDLLKPFADERPASDELTRSRASVKAVLDEARKKVGR